MHSEAQGCAVRSARKVELADLKQQLLVEVMLLPVRIGSKVRARVTKIVQRVVILLQGAVSG